MERAGVGIAHLTRGSYHEQEPRDDGSACGMVRGRVELGRTRRRKFNFPAPHLRLTHFVLSITATKCIGMNCILNPLNPLARGPLARGASALTESRTQILHTN